MESNKVNPVRVSATTPAPAAPAAPTEDKNIAINTLRSRRDHLVNGYVDGIYGKEGLCDRLARAEQSVIDLRKQLKEQVEAVTQIDEALELLMDAER